MPLTAYTVLPSSIGAIPEIPSENVARLITRFSFKRIRRRVPEVVKKIRFLSPDNREFTGNHIISTPCFHALTITYDPNFLKDLLQSDDPTTERLANCVHGAKTWLASHHALSCNERIAGVIEEIRACRFTGMIRYLFLESKMMELFVLQMEQAQTAAEGKINSHWSVADREKLYAVKDYIENTYLEEFTLKELT